MKAQTLIDLLEEDHRIGYHVTFKHLVPRIEQEGLKPSTPPDYSGEVEAVYLFQTREGAEDALGSWLGERIDEIPGSDDWQDVLMTVDITGLKCRSDVEYEWACLEPIPPNRILKVEDI